MGEIDIKICLKKRKKNWRSTKKIIVKLKNQHKTFFEFFSSHGIKVNKTF